jgi:hypothetical protein
MTSPALDAPGTPILPESIRLDLGYRMDVQPVSKP